MYGLNSLIKRAVTLAMIDLVLKKQFQKAFDTKEKADSNDDWA